MSYLETKMDDFDVDYIVSKNTLSSIEKICLEYKIKILQDLSKNLNIPYSELKHKFIDKENKQVKYHGNPRNTIDNTKCMARIWHTKLGPVQCSRNKISDTNLDEEEDTLDLKPMFCKIHQKKLNYGRIDLPFENYEL